MSTALATQPRPGVYPMRATKYSPMLDNNQRRITDGLTPEKAEAWLRNAEDGDVAALCGMQEEMEAKSAHLQGVVSARRSALLSLDWDIEPELDTDQPGKAAIAANYVRDRLRALRSFPIALEHLATGLGPNVAVIELVWLRGELMRLVAVPSHRLQIDPSGRTNTMHIITERDMMMGISTKQWAYKFGVFHPHDQGGYPFRSTITHATVWPYLVCHYARTDWMAYIELYGTPIRTATTDAAFSPEDREAIETMLTNMGPDVSATFPTGIDVKLLTAAGEGKTFLEAIEWAEKKMSILWLGQTLTTDIGDVGSRAAAQVHQRVKADILFGDIAAEARFVRSDIIEPMVRLRFPRSGAPIPHYVRKLEEATDVDGQRLRMEQIRLAMELKLPLDVAQLYDDLDFEKPVAQAESGIGGDEDGEQDETTEEEGAAVE